MSAPLRTKTTRKPLRNVPSFEVTCVIGEVVLDGEGPDTAQEAAFRLIARHGMDGTFFFPTPDGSTCKVTVEFVRSDDDFPPRL